jgi:hypothetical protein
MTCCTITCDAPATFGILGESQSADMESHSCADHLSGMLESGVSTVWPLTEAPHV